jgi:hypothetical protein
VTFADPILPHISELILELTYEFEDEEYRQIIQDFATLVAPRFGWSRDGRKERRSA